ADHARRDLATADSTWDAASSRHAVEEALAAASALAGSLRQFAQASRPTRPAPRPLLAHSPSVPSPLSAGSGSSPAHHRRWVSEDMAGDDGGIQHARNCSDSHIPAGGAQAAAGPLRKSVLSLRKQGQPPLPAADHAKQVRFQAAAEPGVDQACLAELLPLLARLEAAIGALAAAHREGSAACAPAAKSLVAVFVQISRLSSASGLVKHYGRAALAHFKTTTQAVKLLVPLIT
ncbi:hypothetical protein H4R19_007006, partial [Coemansia spiralis]